MLALGACTENSIYNRKKLSFFSSNFSFFFFDFDKEEENQVEELESICIKHPKIFFLNQLFPETSASKSLQFPLQSENELLNV